MNSTFIDFLKQHYLPDKHSSISFATFMDLALFHREWGFYNRPDFHIGKKGGVFVTAPEISPLFAACFAAQVLQIFSNDVDKIFGNELNVLELGAGSGRFAYDFLMSMLSQNPDLFSHLHYYIYDRSEALNQKQQLFFRETAPHLLTRITWLTKLPENFVGVVIANEVLDALPVHCFRVDDHGISERRVQLNEGSDGVQFKLVKLDEHHHHQTFVRAVHALHDAYAWRAGYESEINLLLQPFLQSLLNSIARGIILFADYGYGREEYYHPERRQGTLATIYDGAHHENPLQFPGAQDITAHVDFTRVAEGASECGANVLGYTTQAGFLLSCGIMDFAERWGEQLGWSSVSAVEMQQAIKYLTFPTEMGERVKVMALGKNVNVIANVSARLLGFQWKDHRCDL